MFFLHENLCIGYMPIFKYNPMVKLINCVYMVQLGMEEHNVNIAQETLGWV